MTPEAQLALTLEELQKEGVLQKYGERYETTRRWRAARQRASSSREAASGASDLRNPIVQALLTFYDTRRGLDFLTPYVTVLFALEASEKTPHSTTRHRR